MKQQTKAFTLVELIVVITILAILGTIAFITLQGYSAQARDSRRLADIQNIKKSLELFSLNTGKYPLPDNVHDIEYDGELVWHQGTVGENVTKNLHKNLNELPLDPKSELEYTYSLVNSQNKYELLSIYESDLLSQNTFINKSFATSSDYVRVDGTYNGIFVKTSSYYIPTPSILTSENISSGLTLDESNIKSQIVNGGKNKIEIGLTSSNTGELNIKLSVYTGSITKTSLDTDKKNLAIAIQNAYTGSSIANQGLYKMILEKEIGDDLISLVDDVILNDIANNVNFAKNCDAGTIEGVTYPSISYSYSEIVGGGTTTGTATLNVNDSIKDYTSTITCNDGEISMSNEQEDVVSLYSFTSHTFTNCGKTGQTGPSLSQCTSNYNTTWDSNTNFFNMSVNGIQEWTVPETGTYNIQSFGSQGSNGSSTYVGGKGAKMVGNFDLIVGDILKIMVGQIGTTYSYSGGGGGTFVVDSNNNPLIIAGGGGGGNGGTSKMGRAALVTTAGDIASNGGTASNNGAGGTAPTTGASGGGGFITNGQQSGTSGNNPGLSFLNGGIGGNALQTNGYGGFGGGGGGDGNACGMGGAGGGYSGGSCGTSCGQSVCGGGGSFNNGTSQTNSAGFNIGNGKVIITKL